MDVFDKIANDISSDANTGNRRGFLKTLAAGTAGLSALAFSTNDIRARETSNSSSPMPLVDSPPVLQLPTEHGITVVWAVGRPATGYVEFGTDPNKLDRTAYGERLGLRPFHERFIRIGLTGLEPDTTYFYRTATCSFRYVTAYKFERSEPEFGKVYSFTTPGAGAATASFSVINDTHQNQKTLKLLTDRLAEIGSDFTVWNGDLVNHVDTPDLVVEAILRPAGAPFASEKPLLFVPGNHDYRGAWARNLPEALPTWTHEDGRDRELGRNFALRRGPLALIGLDTGEDKPDWHPAWAGLAQFEPYRVAQRDWLERALARPEIASAPFVAAFCHIPLFDADPNANGGDVLEKWASFQRQGGNLWGPLLTKHRVPLLICAHKHRFRYDEPTTERSWGQVVGGGHGDKEQVTIIRGRANAETLELVVEELRSGKELLRKEFPKRPT